MLLSAIVQAFVDIPPGWATVIGSSLAVIGGGMAAIVGLVWRTTFQLKRIRTDAAKIRTDTASTLDHVENDHTQDPNKTSNLREDLDRKFEGLDTRLSQIDDKLEALAATDEAHEERLRDGAAKFAEIERTIPKALPIEEPDE